MSDNPQVSVWNDDVGPAWVTYADLYDVTLEPFGEAALAAVAVQPGERVVDVGCGAGATTLRLARLAAPAAVTGVDLSKPMLALAAQRAAAAGITNSTFSVHDVQADSLGQGVFEVAFSRFGVMFFDDPVRAFTHIRESLVAGGRVGFVCFQQPAANPFIVVPTMAAAQVLKMPPPTSSTAPSPFALADPERVTGILTAVGFGSVVIEPGPTSAVLGAADDLPAMALRLIEQNPSVGALFAATTPEIRAAAVAAAAAALEPHAIDGMVTLAAATWIVTAAAN
jgi:SAM-dependent methyltransferase